jgi:hypothetical protein
VLEQRLLQARKLLSDPRARTRKISDIAHSVNRRSTGTPYRHPKGTPLIGVLCW